MTSIQYLKNEAQWYYEQLQEALSGVSEHKAWASVSLMPDEYLHSNGTIIGIVQHMAVGKFIYGSIAFRGSEIRWRDCMDRLEKIGTSWNETLAYLDEAHAYWLASWESLAEEDLDADFLHFRGDRRPGWKIIATVIHHDGYHAGQIALLAASLAPTSVPPDLQLDEERALLMELPSW